jgi:hypothetical protein
MQKKISDIIERIFRLNQKFYPCLSDREKHWVEKKIKEQVAGR